MRSFLASSAALFSRNSSSASLQGVQSFGWLTDVQLAKMSNRNIHTSFEACPWDCKLQLSNLQTASFVEASARACCSYDFGAHASC